MRVRCKILPNLSFTDESAVLEVKEMRENVRTALDALSMIDASQGDSGTHNTVLGKNADEHGSSIVLLRTEELVLAHTEQGKVILVTEQGSYASILTLRELEQNLGEGFVRISKSAIVNLDYAERVVPSFGGGTCLNMRNGMREWISRRYWPSFKQSLGL